MSRYQCSVDKARGGAVFECSGKELWGCSDRTLVTPIFLFACESWTLTAELQRRVQAMEMSLPQDTTHLIRRPCYQRGSPYQDLGGNRTTGRCLDYSKKTQTGMVWTCLPFIRSGQNHLARHSERGKKTRQTDEEAGRQRQRTDRP